MGSFTNSFENMIMEDAFGTTPATYPDTYYVGIWTQPISEISDGDTDGEPADPNYARQPVERATGWSTPTAGIVTNLEAVQFPMASVDWGTITHVALLDAETSGNMLAHTSIVPIPIVKDDIVVFRTSEIVVALD